MMQFSMICLVFFLAMCQFSHLACVLIVVETLISMMLQLRSKTQIVTWIQSKEDWQKHKTSMDAEILHIFPMVLKFLGCAVEALDPSMDAWTAANAQSMCHPSLCSKFEKAWQPIPVAGDVVVWLGGLPGILLFLLVASSVVQLAELSTKDRQLRNSLEEMRLFSPDPDTAAHTRWRVWIYFSHMADVGGVMLLQDLFLKLVEVEISLSSQIWPVADRNAAFRSKIMLEASFTCSLAANLTTESDTGHSFQLEYCSDLLLNCLFFLQHPQTFGFSFSSPAPWPGYDRNKFLQRLQLLQCTTCKYVCFCTLHPLGLHHSSLWDLAMSKSHSQHHHWMCPTLRLPRMCLGYIFLRCATEEKKQQRVVIETRNGWHTGWMGPDFLAFLNG